MAELVTFGIDISHHQGAFDLERAHREGVEFVMLKSTEGADFIDGRFASNLASARRVGLLVGAYHYQRSNASAAAQANLIERVVPSDVPIIIDVESGSGSVALTRDIVARLRTAGYRVPLLYLPNWYWEQIGSPSLTGLPPLWSSRYPDMRSGNIIAEYGRVPSWFWNGYGGLPVHVLQYTSAAQVAGVLNVDANAFRGTRTQLATLLNGQAQVREDDVNQDEKIGDAGPGSLNHTWLNTNQLVNNKNFGLAALNVRIGQALTQLNAVQGALTQNQAALLAAIEADATDQVDVSALAAALTDALGTDVARAVADELQRRLSA